MDRAGGWRLGAHPSGAVVVKQGATAGNLVLEWWQATAALKARHPRLIGAAMQVPEMCSTTFRKNGIV